MTLLARCGTPPFLFSWRGCAAVAPCVRSSSLNNSHELCIFLFLFSFTPSLHFMIHTLTCPISFAHGRLQLVVNR